MRRGQQCLHDRRSARRGGAVVRVGRPQHQLLGIIGAVEPATRSVAIGEVRQGNIEQVGRGGQPTVVGGQLVQREQTGGQHRVVFENRCAVADPAAEAGAAQPAVHHVQSQQRRSALGRRRRASSGAANATPASASAVIAKPFQPVTTLSSRSGCVRVRRAASNAARMRSKRSGSSGSSSSCSTDAPASKVPPSVTPKTVAAQRPSSSPSNPVSCAGVHTYVEPSLPSVSASSDEVNMSPSRNSSIRKPAVSAATLRANGSPVRRAQCA